MEIKCSKEEFEGYTHRFVVRLKFDNNYHNNTNINLYSNSDSYLKLENFINENKSDRVIAFTIKDRVPKEQDEMSSKFLNESLPIEKPEKIARLEDLESLINDCKTILDLETLYKSHKDEIEKSEYMARLYTFRFLAV